MVNETRNEANEWFLIINQASIEVEMAFLVIIRIRIIWLSEHNEEICRTTILWLLPDQ